MMFNQLADFPGRSHEYQCGIQQNNIHSVQYNVDLIASFITVTLSERFIMKFHGILSFVYNLTFVWVTVTIQIVKNGMLHLNQTLFFDGENEIHSL